MPYAKADELDSDAFKQFRRAATKSGRMDAAILEDSQQHILENLNLLEGDHLRRAAVLLFYKNPERFVAGAYVKIGFFRSDADLIYQGEVHGNLFEQAHKTLDLLLTKYMKAYIHYDGITRIERFLFPPEALRELILNALLHRDYGSGVSIQIRVYEEQLWSANDGYLPSGWTVNHLLSSHSSKPHNSLIAGAFFRTGDIEPGGRGIEKVRTACYEYDTGFPVFRFEPTGLMVFFKSRIPAIATEQKPLAETRVETQVKILALLRKNPKMTPAQVATQIDRSVSAVERATANWSRKASCVMSAPKTAAIGK